MSSILTTIFLACFQYSFEVINMLLIIQEYWKHVKNIVVRIDDMLTTTSKYPQCLNNCTTYANYTDMEHTEFCNTVYIGFVDRRKLRRNFLSAFFQLMKPLVFQGHQYLRQRVLLSVLSGCPIKIEKIRADQPEPGLRGKFHLVPVSHRLS